MFFLVVADHVDYQREKRVKVSVTLAQSRHVTVIYVNREFQKLLQEPKLFIADKLVEGQIRISPGFHIQVKNFIDQVHEVSNYSSHRVNLTN